MPALVQPLHQETASEGRGLAAAAAPLTDPPLFKKKLKWRPKRPTQIRVGRAARADLRVRLGDAVHVRAAPAVKYATAVKVAAFADTLGGGGGGAAAAAAAAEAGDLEAAKLAPYFEGKYRPLHKGSIFTAGGVDFKVRARSEASALFQAPAKWHSGERKLRRRQHRPTRCCSACPTIGSSTAWGSGLHRLPGLLCLNPACLPSLR